MRYSSVAAALCLADLAAGELPDTTFACCDPLAQALPDLVFPPSTPEYDRLTTSRWSETAVLHPRCVVTPASASDVSAAIEILARGNCRFAVKSGGHNANPGASSIDDGVSVDLAALTQAEIAPDRSAVRLGAGLTWGQAYDAFNNSGIGFPGGICQDVGVGGVAVGGGQSLYLPKLGWVVDNVVNYEVVLASGAVVDANQTSHPELFKALKGGSTNFGVVTRVDIAAFESAGIWGGEVNVNLRGPEATRDETLDALSRAIADFTAGNHRDVGTAILPTAVYFRGGQGQLVNTAVGNTDNAADPPAVRPFFEMPNVMRGTKNGVRHLQMADFAHQVSEFQVRGFRQVTASVTFSNSFETLREVWGATDAVYDSLEAKDEVDWMISFIPQPKIQQSYAAARGGNSLGLSDVEDDQIVLWLTSRWTDPALDAVMSDAQRRFVADARAVAERRGAYHPFLYANYAAPFQDPLCGYGAESAAFLRAAAARYDPEGVFQRLMPGGFKVSDLYCDGEGCRCPRAEGVAGERGDAGYPVQDEL